MNQYTVLLVDDEEEVFQVIMKKLDWESMGFSIAGYARNGVEALEMAEELQPDVVMTDIKMPYMDGLTLCKKLKELYQKVKVIIFVQLFIEVDLDPLKHFPQFIGIDRF